MNVFDLNARLGLNKDDYENGLKNAGEAMKKFGSAAKTIAKVSAAGFSAVATGVSAIAKQAVQSYADYEQLVGGVETLFGAGGRSIEEYAESMGKSVEEVQDKYNALMQSQEAVMTHANEAYRNAGLSANDYIETVTGFSASLLQSLGGDTVKAAEYADRAIVDMADNANKMGTSMEAIQNAYSGFAKANYTMLDNLKLGYGGTGEEMKRLIEDAAGMTKEMNDLGVSVDATDMSFGNIVNAISVMQKHLDIAGTTQKEAASTISGSLSMMKGAWQNLVTGVADDTQDFDSLINNFVDSVDTVAGNIMPRVEQALGGVGKLVEKLVPQVMDRLPDVISKTLPSIMKSAGALIKSFGKAITNNADTLLSYVRDTLYGVLEKLSDTSVVADGVKDLIMTVVMRGRQILDGAEQIGVELVRIIAEAIGSGESSSELIHWFMVVINDLADNTMILLPTLLELGFNIVKMIGQGIVDNVPWMAEEAVFFLEEFAAYLADNAPIMATQLAQLIQSIAEMLTDPEQISSFVDVAISLITTLADSLIAVLPVLLEAAPVIIENLAQAVTENFPKLVDLAWNLITEFTNAILVNMPQIVESGKSIIDNIGLGITSMILTLNEKAKVINETIETKIKEAFQEYIRLGKDIINKLLDGIKALQKKMTEKAVELMILMTTGIAGEFEKVKEKGKELLVKIVAGIAEVQHKIKEKALELIALLTAGISEKFEEVKNKGRELVDKVKDGISDKFESIKETGRNIVNRVKDGIFDVINSAKEWGSDLINNFIEGLTSGNALTQTVSGIAGNIADFLHFSEPEKGPLSDFHESAPDMIDMFVKGLKDSEGKLKTQLQSTASIISDGFTATEIKGSTSRAEVTNIYNITVASGTISSDYDADRAAHRMSERLAFIQTQNRRAVGI